MARELEGKLGVCFDPQAKQNVLQDGRHDQSINAKNLSKMRTDKIDHWIWQDIGHC